MARILAISSQVARGHVGLSAGVPALQALGHEVIALPTILLSNHPGHAHAAGERVAPELLGRMLDALDANGWLAGVDGILTGYLPSAEHVSVAQQAVNRVKARNRTCHYLCDPVMGDWPKGLYIAEPAAAAIRDLLVPLADTLKMNRYEAEWLSGITLDTAESAAAVARRFGDADTIITSLPAERDDSIANALAGRHGEVVIETVTRLANVPNGTGDLMAALYLGHRSSGSATREEAFAKAVHDVATVAAASDGAEELRLVSCLGKLRPAKEAGSQPQWVAGVDGCPGGWMVVLRELTGIEQPRARIVATFADVLALPEAPLVIAVDMPIGLPETTRTGGREPDIEARAILGKRQSSVFAVPARAAVMQEDYAAACEVALAHSHPPRKVSKQTFQLFKRIREIDRLMTPELQATVVECHPEVAFWAMNGERPLELAKKVKSQPNPPGLAFRRQLLARVGFPAAFLTETRFAARDGGADDFLDACACAWTAGRVLRGEDRTFPACPPIDARGLRQEIRA